MTKKLNILPHKFHVPCANTVNSAINLQFHNQTEIKRDTCVLFFWTVTFP